MICDADGPTSLAGIMGGARSEVQRRHHARAARGGDLGRRDRSAHRRSRSGVAARPRRASRRGSRGCSPLEGQAVASALFVELCGARVLPGTIDVGGPGPDPQPIALRPERLARLLGAAIAPERCREILESLGFAVGRGAARDRAALPPRRRHPRDRPDRGGRPHRRPRAAAGDAPAAQRGRRARHPRASRSPPRRGRAGRARALRDRGLELRRPRDARPAAPGRRPPDAPDVGRSRTRSRRRTRCCGRRCSCRCSTPPRTTPRGAPASSRCSSRGPCSARTPRSTAASRVLLTADFFAAKALLAAVLGAVGGAVVGRALRGGVPAPRARRRGHRRRRADRLPRRAAPARGVGLGPRPRRRLGGGPRPARGAGARRRRVRPVRAVPAGARGPRRRRRGLRRRRRGRGRDPRRRRRRSSPRRRSSTSTAARRWGRGACRSPCTSSSARGDRTLTDEEVAAIRERIVAGARRRSEGRSVPSVIVVGASGYAGALAASILWRHPRFELVAITAREDAGRTLTDLYPHHRVPLTLEEFDPDRPADAAVVAYPHGSAAPAVAALLARGVRVVDLSADFRLRDRATYEQLVRAAPASRAARRAPSTASPSSTASASPRAELVACPGCFPTAAILALAPLGELIADVVIDAKTGVSGAGKTPTETTHFVAVDENVRPYGVAGHRHMPEIDQELGALGAPVPIAFVPHLRAARPGRAALLLRHAEGRARASRTSTASTPSATPASRSSTSSSGRPACATCARRTSARSTSAPTSAPARCFVFAAIDNLWKGTSSQAVANLNLMFGYDEGEGLAVSLPEGVPRGGDRVRAQAERRARPRHRRLRRAGRRQRRPLLRLRRARRARRRDEGALRAGRDPRRRRQLGQRERGDRRRRHRRGRPRPGGGRRRAGAAPPPRRRREHRRDRRAAPRRADHHQRPPTDR